ncbi:hypothetical protein HPB48_026146 [Haemaphysalis longicornis]|uniref:CCHC-type domain-containing protein n=1 Tax=Haemaphysalis longicornis TaxID=44386 RepID=A0A9J6HB37_HAELO|nr:hypothetical protein HPB48_026146 [Haemaphysalis longicornis]
MDHIWLVKFRTPAARERILKKGSLQVKGHFCAVIDPINQAVSIKVHRVSFDSPGECLSCALSESVDVKSVKQDAWAANGFEAAESTTRVIQMTVRQDVLLDKLPHAMKFYSSQVFVIVLGRAPLCLRCRRTGHMWHDGRVPWCFKCRSFGHTTDECVRTYARVVWWKRGGT